MKPAINTEVSQNKLYI